MKTRKQSLFVVLALLALLTVNSQFSAVIAGTPPVITNVDLPTGTVGVAYNAQLAATNGQPPYNWSLATNSMSLPIGLSLNSSGLISGKPTTRQTNGILVQVVDANSARTNKALSITIYPRPAITNVVPPTNSIPVTGCQIQVTVSDACGRPVTIQYSTNLANWVNLLTTNLPCDPVTLTLPAPSCAIGYVRVRSEDLCPVLYTYPSYLFFADPADGSVVPNETLTIYNTSSDCDLTFNAVCSPWLAMTSLSYTNFSDTIGPGGSYSIPVALSDYSLYAGSAYSGSILISDMNNPDNSQYVPIVLNINNAQLVPDKQPGASYGLVSADADCDSETTNTPNPTGLYDVPPFSLDSSVSSSSCTNGDFPYCDAAANLTFEWSQTANSVTMSGNIDGYVANPDYISSVSSAQSEGYFSFHTTHLSRCQISGSVFSSGGPEESIVVSCNDFSLSATTNSLSTNILLISSPPNGAFGFNANASTGSVQGPGTEEVQANWTCTVQLLTGPP